MKFIDIFKRPEKVQSLKPFTYLTPSIGTVRKFILVMLVPQIVLLALTKSYQSLIILASTATASLLSEILFCCTSKSQKVEYMSPIIQGLLVGLLTPSSYSFISIFFITLASLYFGKYIFGGFAQSWVNSVALVVAVSYMLNVTAFVPSISFDSRVLSTRNLALSYIQGQNFHLVAADSAVTTFLNRTVFKLFGIVIPDGYVSFFWDTESIIPAFRFNFVTLISSIILMSLDIIDMAVPLIFVTFYAVLVRVAGPIFTGAPAFQGDMIFALLTSGTIFCSLYLLQWYGTVPITRIGKTIYAFSAGLVAFLVMGYGNSSVGFVFTILVMNLISTVIQLYESRMARKRLQNILNPKIQSIREAENA